jgi:hypothetical protein
MAVDSTLGRVAGARPTSRWTPSQAKATPSSVPSPERSSASASIGDTRRHRLPPSAARIAVSPSRKEARTSSRLATFAHAIGN